MFQKHKGKIKTTIKQWMNNALNMKASHEERVIETIEKRNEEIIQRHIQKLSTEYHRPYYIENSVRDCINDIAKAEGDSHMVPGYQYLSDWSKRANAQYINLRDILLERFKIRYSNLQKIEEEKENKKIRDSYANLKNKYADLIQKFFEVTERRVSIIDDYGDESWDELPKQIEIVIKKIAKNEGYTIGNIKDCQK